MWKDMFVNACILITMLFVSSQIFKNGINPASSKRVRAIVGVLGGFSTTVLIYFSIHINSEVVLDFRHFPGILVAVFGGLFPSVITGLITAGVRLTYNGITYVSIISALGSLTVCFGCGFISRTKIKDKIKWMVMFLYSLVICSIVYSIVLEDKKDVLTTILAFWISSIVVGAAVYYLVQYLITAHKLLIKLKKESSHDFLTGLNNTRQFDLSYNQILHKAVNDHKNVSMLIIDIDHFKKVNDTHGHIAGDGVLKELGAVLLNTCRNGDLVSRIGGEEFAVVLEDLTREETMQLAERIRANVESHPFPLPCGNKLKITVSVGVAIYPETISNIEGLKEIADTKLYEAKRTGRNRVCI